jgi:hypothetical protein
VLYRAAGRVEGCAGAVHVGCGEVFGDVAEDFGGDFEVAAWDAG